MFTRDQLQTPDEVEAEGSGMSINTVAQAVMTWVVMNEGIICTIAAAALAFNTTPDLIAEAVKESCWMDTEPADELLPIEQRRLFVDGE